MKGTILALVILVALILAGSASGQELAPGAIDPGQGTHVPIQFTVTQVGDTEFTEITFEGGLNTHGIQATAGATFSANALTLIDSDAGGSGNFANEPSPSTIAFWLSGGSISVTFDDLVSDVGLFYTSSVPVSLQVFDVNGNLLSTINGGAQHNVGCTGDPFGSFCNWTPLSIVLGQNVIRSATFSGVANQTGFEDFTFSRISVPVIVIPGIMGSTLRRTDNNELVWVDSLQLAFDCCDAFLLPLHLAGDGESPATAFPFTCDSVRNLVTGLCLPTTFLVNSAGAHMKPDELLVRGLGLNLYGDLLNELGSRFRVEPFPYDWRKDYVGVALELRRKITELAPSASDKVDIVAHSQGGLVARTYYRLFPNDHRINTVVYLGTPHLGASKSFAILSGWQAFEKYYGKAIDFLNFRTGSFISQNFPAVYELLPRYDFFFVDSQSESFRATYNKLANLDLVDKANSLWDTVIQEANPISRSVAINGSRQNTLLGLVDDRNLGCIVPINDPAGDGTVPFLSSRGLQNTQYFYVEKKHAELPNDGMVIQAVLEILQGRSPSLATEASAGNSITGYSCSPIRMQVFDVQGNMSGLDEEGNLRQSIDNSEFFVFPANEAVFLPADDIFRVLIRATDHGTFSLIFDFFDTENTLMRSDRFRDIPVSINSRGELLLNPEATPQTLQLDVEGDGVIDFVIPSDQPPPLASFTSVLIDVIGTFDIKEGIRKDLTATVRAASASLERGNEKAARNQLEALRLKVNALMGVHLTSRQAGVILRLANKAIELIP